MLQNPFYKGVQREAKTVIEGHFKEAYHLRYWNHIRGQNVEGPDPDTKRRLITPSKSGPIHGSDFARSHRQSILHGGPQVLRSPGVLNLVYSPLTLVQGKRGLPWGISKINSGRKVGGAASPPRADNSRRIISNTQREDRPRPMVIASSENKT